MMKFLKRHNWWYGIQKKVVLFITVAYVLIFLVTYIGVSGIVRAERASSLTEQNTYYNERMMYVWGEIKKELNQIAADFILNEYVQKSLTNQRFTISDREMMRKSLAFLNKGYLDSYLVIDNKQNVYSQSQISIDLEKFYESDIYQCLGNDYSKTKFIWTKDVIFETGEMSLFAVRYIREMNAVHEPGILLVKLNESVFDSIRRSISDDRFAYFIIDEKEEVCFGQLPGGKNWKDEEEKIRAAFWEKMLFRIEHADTLRLEDGVLSICTDEDTGFVGITYAPKEVTLGMLVQIEKVLILTFAAACLGAILASNFYARKLTRPIKYLSETMSSFEESHINQRITLDTNTELDQIGTAYNGMVERVGQLMTDVKMKERELRKSELQSLMYQIRPHFLYNTLDTIYMLARISKEETIMKMIQELSKFLRINLSNGNEEIPVEKELEHVSAYLEIQKIRNAELFEYEIEKTQEMDGISIMKMILQPVAENCIKYGFCDIYEGGKIKIAGDVDGGVFSIQIANNGKPMEEKSLEYLNRLEKMDMEEMDALIQHRQGGFGISNVVRRLRMRYSDGVRFFYTIEEGWTVCHIQIPLSELSGEEAVS